MYTAQDATFLERINKESHELLVALRQEYEEVMAELKEDEEEVAEIESCDQEYLNELKTSLAEQRYKSVVLHSHMEPDPTFRSALSWTCIEPMFPRQWLNLRG